ncbi:MAG: flagellar biosynthesis protein FlhB [Alphaproteobacteria bacterium]|nr:flagellar biosynthesis protein FlhB [Alphaproteobacteria bacterium]
MAEEADKDQKTEEPTSRRLDEAREKGDLAISREVGAWFGIVAILIVVTWFFTILARSMSNALVVFLDHPHQIALTDGGLVSVLLGVLSQAVFALMITFGLIYLMAVLGFGLQTGFYFGTEKIKFDIGNLSIAKGFKKIFSLNAVAEFVKGFFKLVVLGYLSYRVLMPVFGELPALSGLPIVGGMDFLRYETAHLLIVLLIVVTVIAVADFLYTRWRHYQNLRMTKQEVKDEYKQTEGDPMVRARLRQIRLEKARRRMMANVPRANVVITNPTHYAVALEYNSARMAAPVVIAKGVDKVAQRIREAAQEHAIPLVSNPPLARALYDTVDLDDPITPEYYRAVAEIISYVYKLKNKTL